MTTIQIASDINGERRRQDEKWGEQNHPPAIWIAVITEEIGEAAEAVLQWEFSDEGDHDERLIRFREELVRVAAVAIAALESIDRQNAVRGTVPS